MIKSCYLEIQTMNIENTNNCVSLRIRLPVLYECQFFVDHMTFDINRIIVLNPKCIIIFHTCPYDKGCVMMQNSLNFEISEFYLFI